MSKWKNSTLRDNDQISETKSDEIFDAKIWKNPEDDWWNVSVIIKSKLVAASNGKDKIDARQIARNTLVKILVKALNQLMEK